MCITPPDIPRFYTTDWNMYKDIIKEKFQTNPFWFQPVCSTEQLNKRQEFVDNIMLDAFNRACPIIKGTRRTTIPWWTPELTQAKQSAKNLNRKARKSKCKADWDRYKIANKHFSKLIRSQKRKAWRDMCAKVKDVHALSRVNKIIRTDQKQDIQINSFRPVLFYSYSIP